MSNQHCDLLFLSPHLDDTVLSCSLRILQECRRGCSVKVSTLFSSARPKILGTDFYCRRRKEDTAALSVLGVDDPIWLGFPDAVFRGPRYWSFSKITIEEHPEDGRLLDKIAARVRELYNDCTPETIFLPLAVGTHIDHRFTFAMRDKLPAGASIVFYEDRPYSLVSNSVFLRLQDIGVKIAVGQGHPVVDRQGIVDDLVRELSKESMYRNVLKNKHERLRYALHLARGTAQPDCAGAVAAADKQAGRAQEEVPLIRLEAEVLSTQSVNELEQIEKAIAAYRSQVGMLYDNMKTFRDENYSYTQTLDASAVYAERYWRLIR